MKSINKSAVVYLRGHSTNVQKIKCLEVAKRKGYKVVKVIDDGMASANNGSRKGIKLLKTIMGSGTVGAIITLSPDRLFRNIASQHAFTTLAKVHDLAVIYADTQTNATAKMMVDQILEAVKEYAKSVNQNRG